MSRWKRKGCVHTRKRGCLQLEVLEDRTLLSVNVVTSFVGLNTHDAGDQVEPPDPHAAAGPTAIVEMVNSNIAFYSKATGQLLAPEQGLDAFFTSVDPTPTLFSDVNVTYDEQAGRFFVSTMDIAIDLDPTKDASYFDFAISNDSDPLHGFQFYQINTTETSARTGEPLFTDFPRLGWNADAYVVTFNMFGFLSNFVGGSPVQYNVQILTIDKAKLLDPVHPTLSVHKGDLTTNTTPWDRPVPNSTMVPAVMHGSSPGDPMWFVEEKGLEQDGSYQDLRVVKMTGVLSDTPSFTDYYVPMNAYGTTPFPQDTANTISYELDTRILNVDWRNNQMVLAQNVGILSDINVHARWYEMSTAGAAPSLVQQGELNRGPGIDTYMPSVALAADGTIGMTYIESAAGVEDMSMYVTGRAPSDPSGTMQPGVKVSPEPVLGNFYNYDGSRIGDFSGITVDPSDPSTFWAVNEYAIQADPSGLIPNWGTYIGQFNVDTAPAFATPLPGGNTVPSTPKPGEPGIPRKSQDSPRSRDGLLLQLPPLEPSRPNVGSVTASGPTAGPSPRISTGSSFKGLNTHDAGDQVEPPDPHAAAGPTAIVEMVNSNIAFYDKVSGAAMFSQDLGTFFASVDPTPTLFSDVNVTYDEQAGRFFVSTMDIAIDLDPTKDASYFDFAISNDSDPLHGFQFYQINTTETSARTGEALFTDFPRLGWNADAYVVTFNMFGFLSNFVGGSPVQYNVQILTIDKAKLLDPVHPTLSVHKGDLTTNTTPWDRPVPNSTMVPAVMHGSSPGDPMWFVEEKGLEQDGSYQDLRVVKMTGVLSDTPSFTDYYVPMNAYGTTPFPQDTANTISYELDTRILNVDWRNNQMVLAQNVGILSDINVHARWYEMSTAGAAPSMVQQGEINPGPGIDTYMPSVALAADGTIGMTYIESAAGVEDMSMYVTGRAPSDPSGTMQPGVKVSPDPVLGNFYNYDGSRIGDFSGITVDPSDPSTFWAANEYAIQADPSGLIPNWGTWIASFQVIAPVTGGSISGQVFNDLNGDGMLETGEPGFNGVTIDLLDASNNLVASTITATGSDALDGEYSFVDLTAGNYTVVEELPSGWIATSSTSVAASVVDSQDTGGVNFFDFKTVTISGTVFNDLDGDGIQEAGEPGLQNWVVDLLNGPTLVKQVLTDASGNFSFANLGPGTFTIHEELEPGWLETSTVATYTVTTRSGGNTSGEVFGNFETVRISGMVFNDLNGDGVQESGESGLQGWTIDLTKGSSTARRRTDASGNFTFVGVGPGKWMIQEEVQAGWMQTSMPTTYSIKTISGTNVSGNVFGNIAAATHFGVSAPASITAGTSFSFTITALDAFNNTAVGYRGSVTFSSSDPKAILPAIYTFTSADAGVHSFTATLKTAGSRSITATDTVSNSITGSSSITVNPAAPYKLAIARFPYKPTDGAPGSFRVTAQDRYSNTTPSFTDTVHFTSTDPQAVLPADYTFTSADGGVHDFTATLKTAGTQGITVQDVTNPAIIPSSQADILMQPAATSQLLVSGFPSYATAGVPYDFTVTAKDPYGNITPAYLGTVMFGSSDNQAMLPGNYSLTSGDAGRHTFAATLNTPGQQSISATDTADASITGSESMIVVFVSQPTASVSGPTLGVPGQPLAYTLDASESGLPAGTMYSYSVQWEKGGPLQNYSGSSSAKATHVYTGLGAFTITVMATDPDGNISAPVSQSVSITTLAMETDPYDSGLTALYVGGTTGSDNIAITPATTSGGVKVGMNYVNYGNFFPTGHVVVYSQAGNDIIKTAAQTINGVLTYVNVPVLFFAGNGNDILNVTGSRANNVLVGGGGTVRLLGGQGRDILIGGAGQTTLQAGAGGDILIGGTTVYDNNAAALAALLAEWGRNDIDFATRMDHLTGKISGGLNGNFLLITKMGNANTVFDNGLADNLQGGAGMDWFFAGMMDAFFNKTNSDFVTAI